MATNRKNYTDTALSGYQFTPWLRVASEIDFLFPEKFTLAQCRVQTRDLSICSWIATAGPMCPNIYIDLLVYRETFKNFLVKNHKA